MKKYIKPETDLMTYIAEMQYLYQFTEREFLEFDKVVPMRFNPTMNVVSPKLYFLLMTICGQIESTVIHICKNLDMYKKNENFGTCYKKLLKESDIIERQSVEISATRQIIKPFVKTNTDTPSWWTSYNKVKHTIPKGIEHSTVKNTVHALAGLYLLMTFHRSIPIKTHKDILNTQYWVHDYAMNPIPNRRNISFIPDKYFISTLFILKSHFRLPG